MSSIDFPHPAITVLIFVLTIFSFWLRRKTSLERCAMVTPRRNQSTLEKLSLAVIVFWGLHNVNVLALEAWCSFEKKYHKFFAFEAFTWSVSKALDYSIMFFKSKELQCEPVLQIKKAKILQRYFLFCASMVFILDVASIVSNLNRGGTSFTQDCVLEYSSIAPSQDQLSVIITVIYIFFEPSATISGLYLFIKPFLKYRKLQRTVAAASLGSTSDPKYPSAEHLEEPPNSNVEQKEIEGEPSTRKESQQDFSNLLRTTLFWNCIGVFASQLSVWLVNMQWFLSEDLAAWLKIHYWIHPFDAYFHILCIHLVFLDFQTIPKVVKSIKKRCWRRNHE